MSTYLLPGVAGLVLAYLLGTARLAGGGRTDLRAGVRRVGRVRVAAFLTGCAVVGVALLPPVAAAAQVRLSVHMAQHVLLVLVAAPALAAGAAGLALLSLLPVRRRATVARWRHRARTSPWTSFLRLPATAWLAHVCALWLWHLPAAHDAVLRLEPLHLVEHATLLLTACGVWWHVLSGRPGRTSTGATVSYVAATAVPSAALGAVLTWAGRPLYGEQAAAAARAGVDPLVDQRVAGLVVLVPASTAYLVVTVGLFLPWLLSLADGTTDRPVGDDRPGERPPADPVQPTPEEVLR